MNQEVYFNQEKIIKVDSNTIEGLKSKAKVNASGKYRLCMQHNSQDNLHEMFIVRKKGDYCRPDKHLYTTESHTIVDGAMLVIIFEEDGQIKELFELSKDKYHTYRIDTNMYHMQIPLTEQVVYYEVKLGPFTDKSNIFPEWAPEPHDTEKVTAYMKELDIKIRNFRGKK
jgi:cupin fold WbuC family metalloprotein